AEPMLAAFGAEAEVVTLGGAYIRIISLVVFFQFIGFLGSAALRGAGDTVTPLWIGVLVNLVNFGINVNLIFGNAFVPRLGVPGRSEERRVGKVWRVREWGYHVVEIEVTGLHL